MRRISSKRRARLKEDKEKTVRQFDMFLDMWKRKSHHSEISGKYLGRDPLSTYFHHILPKSKYPEARYDEDNIILLTPDEHEKVENDPSFYEEINLRRAKLQEKYERRNII